MGRSAPIEDLDLGVVAKETTELDGGDEDVEQPQRPPIGEDEVDMERSAPSGDPYVGVAAKETTELGRVDEDADQSQRPPIKEEEVDTEGSIPTGVEVWYDEF